MGGLRFGVIRSYWVLYWVWFDWIGFGSWWRYVLYWVQLNDCLDISFKLPNCENLVSNEKKNPTWLPSSFSWDQPSAQTTRPQSGADGKENRGTFSPPGLQHDSYGNRWWLQYSISLRPAPNTHTHTRMDDEVSASRYQANMEHQTCLTVWDRSPESHIKVRCGVVIHGESPRSPLYLHSTVI